MTPPTPPFCIVTELRRTLDHCRKARDCVFKHYQKCTDPKLLATLSRQYQLFDKQITQILRKIDHYSKISPPSQPKNPAPFFSDIFNVNPETMLKEKGTDSLRAHDNDESESDEQLRMSPARARRLLAAIEKLKKFKR